MIVALAIKYESPGPVLDRDERIGVARHRFKLLKFRIARHYPDHPDPSWAAPDITRVGQFLRYTRIEELPQLINVLRGDMTLLDGGSERPSFLL